MTIEYTLLGVVFLILLLAVFDPNRGILPSFKGAAPSLGARLEKEIEVGHGFRSSEKSFSWETPSRKAFDP